MKDSKNHAVWARCHLAGEASAHDWTIISSAVSGSHKARVRRRVALKRAARSVGVHRSAIVLKAMPPETFSVDKQSKPKPATFVHFGRPRLFGSILPMPLGLQLV